MRNILKLTLLFFLLSCGKKNASTKYLLTSLSKEESGVDFQNIIEDDANHNIVNYLYYYNGGGVAIGDINNDGLADIYFISNKEKNKLFLNKGNMKFQDITEQANVSGTSDWNTGVTMVDINSDGLLDIYVCAVSGLLDFKGRNELFINNGDGTFTEKAKEYGLDFKGYSTQAYFFDYDKDDDLDVYIVNHAVHTKTSHGPALIREKRSGLVGDVLLKNENGKFIDASKEANIFGGVNGYGLSASIADFNNDGWDDIYVCNDFHEDDYYYLNNKNGTFKESLASNFSTISRFSMGSDAADINNDGFQDIITLDMLPKVEKILKSSEGDVTYNVQDYLIKLGYQKQYSRNMLQLNSKGEYFTEAGLFNGVADTDWSWAPLIADFNQDGIQDIFVSNGIYKRPNNLDFMRYIASSFKNKSPSQNKNEWLINSLKEMPNGKVPNQLFSGNSLKFENKNGTWINNNPSLTNGAAYGDLDNDGDLDLVLNNLNDYAQILENTSNSANNFIKIKLNYQNQNIAGLGSKIILYSNYKKQSKQLFLSRGFISSVDQKIHFGLGNENKIDSLFIIWPNNTFQKILNPQINKEIIVNYDNKNNSTYNYKKSINNKLFNKVDLINFSHKEDEYNDFNYEKLIPYKVSTAGPAIAVSDVDNNGFEDLFIGNSSGKKATFYLNDGISFTEKIDLEIEKDSLFEDIDAAFFDADGDNDLDLYVSSGINKTRDSVFELDRLYFNNGNGHFTKTKNKIPENFFNSSIVKPYDYDSDGDVDLFIGNRSNPNDFGQNVASYILNNDGMGNFTKSKSFILKSKVTDAIWSDLNGDGLKDLLVSTEWDTPKIYININGVLDEQKLNDELHGLWQTITTYDIDEDGDQDILLGNWGLNSKFQPSNDAPLLMYYSDFDNNGKKETVLSYRINDVYYPVNSKDELASQMNIINRRFVKYDDFAFQPIEEVLTKQAVNKSVRYKVHTMASGYIINENGKLGKFIEFPNDFQLSPIMSFLDEDFNKDGKNELLTVGNFYDLNTYHGIFNSFNGFLLEKGKPLMYKSASDFGLDLYKYQLRKVLSVKMKNFELLIAMPNNDSLRIYSYK